ncbi:hypothetical protein ACH52_3422 [Eubacterium limosum]|nr:hypothetical protein ACH52_3422 [Eubacterium limosum]
MNNKKKAAILISSLAIIAVLVIGGTLAYFTDTDNAQNVFTLGKVTGEITESSIAVPKDPENPDSHEVKAGTPTDEGYSYDHIVPGDWLSKEPVVSLTNTSEDAYVRVKLEVEENVPQGQEAKLTDEQKAALISEECLNFGDDWTAGADGYIYYNNKLSLAGPQATEPVFTLVKIPETWGNGTANVNFSIKITADLVQYDNFKPGTNAAGKIDSWGDVTIEKAAQ